MAVGAAVESTRQVVAVQQIGVASLPSEGEQLRRGGLSWVHIDHYRRRAAQVRVPVVHLTVVPGRVRADKLQGGIRPPCQDGFAPDPKRGPIFVYVVAGGRIDDP